MATNKRKILENARKTILVADHFKFERTGPVRVCNISEIDVFVTDLMPPAPFVEVCAANGVQIVTTAGTGDDADVGWHE